MRETKGQEIIRKRWGRDAIRDGVPMREVADEIDAAIAEAKAQAPIPMRLVCPGCCTLHIDEGVFATKPHHTHACQKCGMVWRPAIQPTVGVQFLPGFKNEA